MDSPTSSQAPSTSSSWVLFFFKLLVSKNPEGQLLRIQLSVLITIAGMFSLLFLGCIRRFVRFGFFLKYLTKIIYILIPISITYIMGLMHNASQFHLLYPFWACALLYAYGGVITMTACDFSDNDDSLQYFWRTLPLFFWTMWLYLLFYNDAQPVNAVYGIALYAILLFLYSAVLNTKETLNAFYRASKSKGLPYVVEPTARYMREGGYISDEGTTANPSTYKYLVWDDPHLLPENGRLITTKDIWESVGNHFLADCADRAEDLKDLCLSYAFFRLILRRFADFPIDESSDPQTRRFIQEGLLASINDPAERIKRAFHIIEVELQFLFDFFYTKSHSSYGVSMVIHHLINVGGTLVFAFHWLPLLISPDVKLSGIQFHGHSLEVGITRIATIIFCILEIWTIFNVWFSDKMMVRRLSTCTLINGRSKVTQIKWIWNVKDWFSKRPPFRFFFKPWQRQLGQYSFLDNYNKFPMSSHPMLRPINGPSKPVHSAKFLSIPRAGQVGDTSVELSIEVKQAIVTSLLQLLQEPTPNAQPVRLSRGRATIARYPLSVEISQSCQLRTDIHVILVWHIATCLCARHRPPENNDPTTDFLIATQLSNYCAYLVTFAPELLTNHPFITERLFDAAVQQAKRDDKLILFNMPNGNANVEINISENPDVVHGDPNEVVARGITLAHRLMNEAIFSPNPALKWKFLAEFWAELLLYLAPSDKVAVHGEYLARGGEFITHLWALLTHAGIVTRSIHCPPMEN